MLSLENWLPVLKDRLCHLNKLLWHLNNKCNIMNDKFLKNYRRNELLSEQVSVVTTFQYLKINI